MSDSPLQSSKALTSSIESIEKPQFARKTDDQIANDPPMIAGRLLVYDIDEEPPQIQHDKFRRYGTSDSFLDIRLFICEKNIQIIHHKAFA